MVFKCFNIVCTSIFEFNPPPIVQGLDYETGKLVTQIITARDKCVANVSLITIAADLGFVDPAMIDITSAASGPLDDLDYDIVGQNVDLQGAASIGTSPSEQIQPVLDIDMSAVTTSALNDVIVTTLPDLKTKLNDLKNTIDGMVIAAALFTFSPAPASASSENAAIADFTSRASTVSSAINDLIITDGVIDTNIDNVSALKTNIDGIISNVDAVKTTASELLNNYQLAMDGLQAFSTQVGDNVNFILTRLQRQFLK
jgi:hypothetical protein